MHTIEDCIKARIREELKSWEILADEPDQLEILVSNIFDAVMEEG